VSKGGFLIDWLADCLVQRGNCRLFLTARINQITNVNPLPDSVFT
jgi:hypothetical protein